MNIDLLLTPQGEAGLVADTEFQNPVAGVMVDALTGLITLEFADSDALDLNIPAGDEAGRFLSQIHDIHVGAIARGVIADSRQVPLVLLNDPFGGGNAGFFAVRPRRSVTAFENFMKRCSTGQPVHRDDLGDEASASSVLGGISAAVLQFAPHLARQRQMEIAPNPHLAPSAPGLGPGGMRGGGGGGVRRPPPQSRPLPEDDEE